MTELQASSRRRFGFLEVLWADFLRAGHRRGFRVLVLLILALIVFVGWGNFRLVAKSREQISQLVVTPQLRASVPPDQLDRLANYEKAVQAGRENQQRRLRALETVLSHSQSHRISLSFWGTLPGVFLGSILMASFVGAEYRWNYWLISVVHQASRWRLIVSKISVGGALIAVTLILVAVLSYPVNSMLARAYDLPLSSGSPPWGEVATWIAQAWIGIFTYCMFTTLFTVLFRSSLAGFAGMIAVVIVDGVAVRLVPWLTHIMPVQQVALFASRAHENLGLLTAAWFPAAAVPTPPIPITDFTANSSVVSSADVMQGMLVLLLWMFFAGSLAVWAFVKRDVPG